MNWADYISWDPRVIYGKPVISGTRVPVDLVLEKLAKGETFGQLLSAYPHLNGSQLSACLYYATDLNRNEDFILTAT